MRERWQRGENKRTENMKTAKEENGGERESSRREREKAESSWRREEMDEMRSNGGPSSRGQPNEEMN